METGRCLSQNELLRRDGWTVKAIQHFHLRPVETRPNPVFRNRPDMKLFSLKEIKRIEKSDEFDLWKENNLENKKIAQKALDTKIKQLVKRIQSAKIVVTKEDDIPQKAVDGYNAYKTRQSAVSSSHVPLTLDTCDPDFLDKLAVNYVWHNLVDGIEDWSNFGRIGRQLGAMLQTQKVLRSIASVYPEYRDECRRQFLTKFGRELYREYHPLVAKPVFSFELKSGDYYLGDCLYGLSFPLQEKLRQDKRQLIHEYCVYGHKIENKQGDLIVSFATDGDGSYIASNGWEIFVDLANISIFPKRCADNDNLKFCIPVKIKAGGSFSYWNDETLRLDLGEGQETVIIDLKQ